MVWHGIITNTVHIPTLCHNCDNQFDFNVQVVKEPNQVETGQI